MELCDYIDVKNCSHNMITLDTSINGTTTQQVWTFFSVITYVSDMKIC